MKKTFFVKGILIECEVGIVDSHKVVKSQIEFFEFESGTSIVIKDITNIELWLGFNQSFVEALSHSRKNYKITIEEI
jgi:hypothetical protein